MSWRLALDVAGSVTLEKECRLLPCELPYCHADDNSADIRYASQLSDHNGVPIVWLELSVLDTHHPAGPQWADTQVRKHEQVPCSIPMLIHAYCHKFGMCQDQRIRALPLF